jgi:serine/threonine protein phosphatase PrpC
MTTALQCPSCGEPVGEADDFCERCGARLHAPAPEEGACPKCGAPASEADADGYCGRCGARLPRPTDHWEVEAGAMALVSDKGLHHHRNEDAGALRVGAGFSLLVVCDGVSTTANPDQASAAAASAVAEVVEANLAGVSPSPQEAATVLLAAIEAAQKATLDVPQEEPGGYPQSPSSTLVTVVAVGSEAVAANVGDSRAYWIDTSDAGGSRVLSEDDSMAEAAIRSGESPGTAYARPDAHMITHWLGPDAPEPDPHVATVALEGPGELVVCSDGLWNYYESAEAVRTLLLAGPEGETTLARARRLVDAAIAAGGQDNITVALLPVPGPQSPAGTELPPAVVTPAETLEAPAAQLLEGPAAEPDDPSGESPAAPIPPPSTEAETTDTKEP